MPEPAAAQRPVWGLSMLIILVGAFMAILDSSIVNVAIPTIMSVFGASTDTVQWVVTIYMLVLGVVVPASGWLGDRLGYKRLYIASLVLFTLGSALCAFSWNIDSLIVFRVIQALGGGMIMPTTMAMAYRMVPRDRIGTAMGLFGIAIVMGPAIGPTLGGYLVEYVDWRFIFTINIPIGILGALAAAAVLREFDRPPAGPFDVWGFLTSAAGLFSLLLALSQGETYGWGSEYIVVLFYLSAVFLALFVYLELTVPHPLLDLRVFRYQAFTVSGILLVIASIGLFSGIFYIPLFLQTVEGLGAMQTGLVMMPSALVTGLLMPISGRLFDRFGARPLALAGLVILAVTTYLFHNLTSATPAATVLWWMIARSFGMGLMMMPVTAAGMAVIPTEQVGRASAISNIIQRVAGSFGLAALTSLLTSRTAAHAEYLAEGVNPGNPTAVATLRHLALALHQPLASALSGQGPAALAVAGLVQQQAFVLGIDDIFLVSAALVALGLVPAFFLRRHAAARRAPALMPGD